MPSLSGVPSEGSRGGRREGAEGAEGAEDCSLGVVCSQNIRQGTSETLALAGAKPAENGYPWALR